MQGNPLWQKITGEDASQGASFVHMMHDDEEIVLSTKHVKLRVALFIVAFVVAIIAFAKGVLSMGEKKPGF